MQIVKSGARAQREDVAYKTREQVAHEAGCSVSSIVNLENGVRLSAELAERLAHALGCSVEALYENVVFEARA